MSEFHLEKNTSLFGQLENALKILAASVSLIAILGLPAVYSHYNTYSIPLSFIGYDQIIKAGTIPFLLFVIFLSYINWSYKQFKYETGPKLYVLISIFLVIPFFFMPIVIYFLGAISFLLIYVWAVTWPFVRLLEWALDGDFSNRSVIAVILGAAIIIIILRLLFVQVFRRLKKRTKAKLLRTLQSTPGISLFSTVLIERYRMRRRNRRREKIEAQKKLDDDPSKWDPPPMLSTKNSGYKLKANDFYMYIGVNMLFVSFVWSLWLLLYLIDINVDYITSIRAILTWCAVTVASIAVCAVTIIVLNWLWCDNLIKKRLAFSGVVLFVGGLVFLIGYAYSSYVYGRIPQGLGGGMPITIDISVKASLAPDLLKEKEGANGCHASNTEIFCEEVSLLYHDSEIVIINVKGQGKAPAFIINRDAVKAFAISTR